MDDLIRLLGNDKEDKEKLKVRYALRLTEEELERYKRLAEERGETLGEFLRNAIRQWTEQMTAGDKADRTDELIQRMERLEKALEELRQDVSMLSEKDERLDKKINIVGHYFIKYYELVKDKSNQSLLKKALQRLREIFT